jgi:hypothetical protein
MEELDPVERQTSELAERIPPAMEEAGVPMTVRQIANALSYYSNAPWCVLFAVYRLEGQGVLQRVATKSKRAMTRWRLTPR